MKARSASRSGFGETGLLPAIEPETIASLSSLRAWMSISAWLSASSWPLMLAASEEPAGTVASWACSWLRVVSIGAEVGELGLGLLRADGVDERRRREAREALGVLLARAGRLDLDEPEVADLARGDPARWPGRG